MEYNFDNERPIYIQLVEMLKSEIISGRLDRGVKLPSVREYSLLAKVNPNTMQKALMELEREKLIYTERTNGKYVTTDEKIINNLKGNLAKQLVDKFIKDMSNIGITNDEVINYLKVLERNDWFDVNRM